MVELVNQYAALGVQFWLDDGQLRFRAPAGVLNESRRNELRAYKEALIAHIKAMDHSALRADPSNRYEPFPITDVQAAYLVGRENVYEFGGVGCHGYVELTMPMLEKDRLEKAWHSLIQRHDMLRAVVFRKGYQQVLATVTLPLLQAQDLRGANPVQTQAAIQKVRAELSTRQYISDQWPVYELFLTTTDESSILHLSIDMLIADFISVNVILAELDYLYHQPETPLPKLEVTYRDILLAQRAQEKQLFHRPQREQDRQYWLDRMDQMPEAPEWPIVETEGKTQPVSFTRYQFRLDPAPWNSICEQAKRNKLTASSVVLAAFAEVLRLWSKRSDFCVNITILNRPELHPQINQIVGDFTTVNILEIVSPAGRSFLERVQALQQRLWLDMEHGSFSGIEVLRELSRRRNKSVIIPFVYTSMLGTANASRSDGEFMRDARLTYGISQTPQVWIDCQVSERCGELQLNWDVRQGIFPAGVIEDAFEVFVQLLKEMAAGDNVWQQQAPLVLPAHVQAIRKGVNSTAAPIPAGLLQDGFCYHVKCRPDAPALCSEGRQFTYRELADHAVAVQQALLLEGCQIGDIVAVFLEKGVWQVAAVLGILLAGGVYLPIDVSQPPARRDKILQESKAYFVVTYGALAEPAWEVPVSFIKVEELPLSPSCPIQPVSIDPSQPAYVIYTSGSTGRPKGVVISHRAALNTLQDINTRFEIDSNDKILGLANLGFDLSVYDIFGLLTAGGSVILPDAKRKHDPAHWADLLIKHDITIWNSVPAQMQMLLSYWQSEPILTKIALRLALLSGDWIPTSLPPMLYKHCPGVKAMSLGGATEAAIWSIVYPLDNIPDGAKRIPYGTPLANQSFYILNEQGQPCPDWTVGQLYIGGIGLALEYLGDQSLTLERFIVHPQTHERLYRTGDLGRYRPDGVIEFLGREDTQVKLHGYRIELSEIESVLQNHPSISSSVVIVNGKHPQEYRLAAFVETCRLPSPHRSLEATAALREACLRAGETFMVSVDRSLFVRWMELADRTALLAIMNTFRDFGLFTDSEIRHSREEIQAAVKVLPKYYRLLKRWLQALCAEKMLRKDDDTGDYSLLDASLDHDASVRCWKSMEHIEEKIQCGAGLVGYLRESSSHLPALLCGDVDPLALFFPQGKLETAMATYHDNLISRCLHSVVIKAVQTLVARHARLNDDQPVRILEVGAGVGGTSVELIPALVNQRVEYFFTDVSTFFLNEARSRFAEYPWVRYGLFDINKEYWRQGLTAASWDIIICANVLHDSHHTPDVLTTLQELAVPGGALIIIETTREVYSLLTSIEFQEGLSEFTDSRAHSDQTFFSREQWLHMFADIKLEVECEYPNVEDPLACAGQTAFITRFREENAAISAEAINDYLRSQLPEYMVPGHIEVLPHIPLSSNGKVDRAALRQRSAGIAAYTPSEGETAQDDLEIRMAGIWAAALNRPNIWRNEDFFAAGGDSLLVAQVVAKMREILPEATHWEWERLMQEMLRAPTVMALARQLRSPTPGAAAVSVQTVCNPETPFVVLAEGQHSGGAINVLFHDGTGTLGIYSDLLPYLIHAPNRTETIAGFRLTEDKAFLSLTPDQLILRLGQQYADVLLRHDFGRVTFIGHCIGGLIAMETARVLLEAGVEVAPVTVIDSNPFPYQIEDELFMERVFGLLIGADISRAGHVIPDTLLKQALEEVLVSEKGVISTAAVCALSGSFASVAKSYRQLAAKPQHQRLAELYAAVPSVRRAISERPPQALDSLYRTVCHSFRGVAAYAPLPFAGDISAVCVLDTANHFLPFMDSSSAKFWQSVTLGDLQIHHIEGNHLSCLQSPRVSGLIKLLLQGDQ